MKNEFKEISVLRYINNDGNTTQRHIARLTGISLGQVNIILKGLVNRGLIRLEVTNSRTIKYILTSEGRKQKADAVYKYILSSLKATKQIEEAVEDVLREDYKEGITIILIEQKDGIYGIITKILGEKKISTHIINELDIVANFKNNGMYLALAWDSSSVQYLKKNCIRYINILDRIFFDEKDGQKDCYGGL